MPVSFAARRNAGKCGKCRNEINVGEDIVMNRDTLQLEHVRCPK